MRDFWRKTVHFYQPKLAHQTSKAMPATWNRSSSVPRPVAKQPTTARMATRSRGQTRFISSASAPSKPAFLADDEQDIILLAPIVQQTELGIPVEDILKAPASPDLIQKDLPIIPGAILNNGKWSDSADLITHHSPEPAISLATGRSSRMYSYDDVREIIRSVMTEYTISSEIVISKTLVKTAQHNMGSQIILDVGDDVSDLQTIIEIDQRKSRDNSLIESRWVTVKEYTITTTHQTS